MNDSLVKNPFYLQERMNMVPRLWDVVGANVGVFTRTTDSNHTKSVQQFWNKISHESVKESYSGWYSEIDEAFYSDYQIEDGPNNNKIAKETSNPLEWVEEENYVFRIGPYLPQIRKWLQTSVHPKMFLSAFSEEYLHNEDLRVSHFAAIFSITMGHSCPK
ncbi:MARS [Lepeophtheirus salmonis]|uniref:MARS n=1 Tax=Lepeophtheirus salmonis TaxID=72036 RepID=A0A7R8CKJ4_LEPSM|nr:MARS [Lepeophtheirus salmonis]CAF2847215.1 MARS [Lepeophtheirus salmonis]